MKRIALFMENSRAYGREMIRGIADLNQTRHDTVLEMIDADDLKSASRLQVFDGIIARVVTREACRVLQSSGLPVVDVLCQFTDTGFMLADSNHRAIGEQAADFFISRGFKSFAFFGFKDVAFSEARRIGYTQRLQDVGATCHSFCSGTVNYAAIFAENMQGGAQRAERFARWLRGLPDRTALFCANDIRAYQALRVAADVGIIVPDQLVVLGVDNDPLICAFARPQLSSIDPNAHDVGCAAATLLNEAIGHGAPARKGVATSAPQGIIERASTGFLHDGPAWLKRAVDFILANTDKPLSTADIVRFSKLSHTSVEKAFHQFLGESTGKYILRTKMNEAKRLLGLGNINSKEVAFRVGFASPQHFCRTFKIFFGHAPFTQPRN